MSNKLTEKDIIDIISQGESERIEFKAILRDPLTLAQNLSALANTKGGTLLVGIKEPDIIVGTNVSQVLPILKSAQQLLSPFIDVNVQLISIQNKTIVALTVEASDEVVFSKGQVLGRIGSTNSPMTPTQLTTKLGTEIKEDEIRKIASAMVEQSETIQKLRDEIREANSLRNKLKDYLVGGLIGAVIGFLLSLLLLLF